MYQSKTSPMDKLLLIIAANGWFGTSIKLNPTKAKKVRYKNNLVLSSLSEFSHTENNKNHNKSFKLQDMIFYFNFAFLIYKGFAAKMGIEKGNQYIPASLRTSACSFRVKIVNFISCSPPTTGKNTI